jgi:phosphate regulon transcriptional regulator PhoB
MSKDHPKHILVIDDEADLVELVTYHLRKEGFAVDAAPDAESALVMLKNEHYDLVSLDLMLPGMQGIEFCRMLRDNPRTATLPVIMLTAKGEEIDRVIGLEMGADDYMTKPFSPRELIARIKALLRRSNRRPAEISTLRFGELEIDTERYKVTLRGNPVQLTSTEFKLLLYLAERRGKVITRGQLLDAVWKDDEATEQRKVDVHIRRLRTAIEKNPDRPHYIKTLRGIGYYFEQNIPIG